MRVYISADLEGVNGVVHSSQTQPGEPGYERAVDLMHAELSAVIEGARSGGADEVVVADAHWDARNLRHELLPEGTTLLTGWQRPYSMMSGIHAGSFDCIFFTGYHARAGVARGVLSHTYRAKVFLEVCLNGIPVGETGLNAALAGRFGVPVALVTGDDAACAEATELLGGVRSVAVKQAVSRYSAFCQSQDVTIASLRAAAARALSDKGLWRLFVPPSPSTLSITLACPSMADGAELLPQVTRVSDSSIEVSDADYSVLFKLMLAIGVLGASRRDPHF